MGISLNNQIPEISVKMDLQSTKNEELCPRTNIAVYLDGDLSPSDEIALEKHFAECKLCLSELNLQKKMLSALDFAFDSKSEIELPPNFAKVVVTTAESNVSGLRSKKERLIAFFLCAVMFLMILIGLGAETEKLFSVFRGFTDQFVTVVGFIFHFVYGITVGISVILKSLSQQLVFSSVTSFLLILGVFFISFAALSRLIIRYNR